MVPGRCGARVRRVRWRAGSLRGVSMTLYLVKVPPDLAARVAAEPDLLNQVWREDDVVDQQVAALREDDTLMEDYLDLGRMVNEQPGHYPWLEKALHGTGTEIAFEFGYGAGFVIAPQEAAGIAAGLAEDAGWRPGDEVVTIADAIAAFYLSAAENGRVVIGGVG
jgi:hypothetical protein